MTPQRGSVTRLPVVGVMGSGTAEHAALAEAAGRVIARLGCHLLTGGHGGVMRAASRAFVREPGRRGLCIGVLKAGGEPNEFVELPIRTHLPLSGEQGTDPMSRNHVNVLTADALVFLPGGGGTRSELELAFRYGRPVVLFLRGREDLAGSFADLLSDGAHPPARAWDEASLADRLREAIAFGGADREG